MKTKFLAAVSLALLVNPAFAFFGNPSIEHEMHTQVCQRVHGMAYGIILSKLANAPMHAVADSVPDVYLPVVQSAYRQPVVVGEAQMKAQADDFAQQVFLACLIAK